MTTKWWARFRAIERCLKVAALWLFFYRFSVHTSWYWLKGSPDVCHGPVTWSRWRLFSISLCRASVQAPSYGWNLWIYTPRKGAPTIGPVDRLERRNVGRCIDIHVDRRILAPIEAYL